MSFAHSLPLGAAAPRSTPARLVSRVLRDRELKRRLHNLRVVPLGGHQALRGIAGLVASSETGECYELDAQMHPGGLAEAVAMELQLYGDTEGLARAIDGLERARLIGRDQSRVWLSLPAEAEPEAGVVPAVTSRIGRRRKDETREAYERRLAQARQLAAAQRAQLDRAAGHQELPLPLAVVAGTESGRDPSDRGAADFPQDLSGDFSSGKSPAEVAAEDGGSPSGKSSASHVRTDDDEDSQSTDESAESSSSSVTARAGEDFSRKSDFPEKSGGKSQGAGVREPDAAALDLARQVVSGLGRPGSELQPLAIALDRLMAWGQDARAALPGRVEAMLEQHRRKEGRLRKPIGSPAAYLESALRDHLARMSVGELPVAAGPPAPPSAPPSAPASALGEEPPENDWLTCPAPLQPHWAVVRAALKQQLGAVPYRTWFRQMRLICIERDALVVDLPSAFLRDHIRREYGETLLQLWRQQDSGVRELVVRRAGDAAVTGS